ncbi:alpha-ketoglutarate-dependent dioxygenase AlkB (plasmid) [Pseudoalteromonas sp. T1lg65]|uniref:alpha-ketoglutarate-dependent dioxygenase AlkB n=1 Tax=Pseudoalteromonas sp. T1lg65 TaxID=2077101 RepID=UPI003F79098C
MVTLPLDCSAHYYPQFMTHSQSHALFTWLSENCDLTTPDTATMPTGEVLDIWPWKMMFVDPKLVDPSVFPAEHGRRQAWCPLIEQLQQQIKEITGIEFSVGVCLFYPNGEESMGFHTDLSAFGPTNVIASISLGAERNFLIRSQSNPELLHDITLEDGSLFIMGEGFQNNYEHAIAKGNEQTGPRFNITFRQFGWDTSFATRAAC